MVFPSIPQGRRLFPKGAINTFEILFLPAPSRQPLSFGEKVRDSLDQLGFFIILNHRNSMRADSITSNNVKNRIGSKGTPEMVADVRLLLEEKRQGAPGQRQPLGPVKSGEQKGCLCHWAVHFVSPAWVSGWGFLLKAFSYIASVGLCCGLALERCFEAASSCRSDFPLGCLNVEGWAGEGLPAFEQPPACEGERKQDASSFKEERQDISNQFSELSPCILVPAQPS